MIRSVMGIGLVINALAITAFGVTGTPTSAHSGHDHSEQEAPAEQIIGPNAGNPERWIEEWPDTDFLRSIVYFDEISDGPPKDGIPALIDVSFIPAAQETHVEDPEPVITFVMEGETPRAYPVRYLMWHEIINDTVGGVPVAVTYCPTCNSGIVFDRRVEDRVLIFGVTGKLRNANLIMYDLETLSWWQQAVSIGIVGHYAGVELRELTAWTESFADFKARNPQGLVMDEPDLNQAYGNNPYVSYDTGRTSSFYNGENPPHGIHPLARVVRVGDRAWPFERLVRLGAINEAGVRISWESGQASPLDDPRIAKGRDIGSVRVRDSRDQDIPHDVLFAYAFHAFWPDGTWMLGD